MRPGLDKIENDSNRLICGRTKAVKKREIVATSLTSTREIVKIIASLSLRYLLRSSDYLEFCKEMD